ncbi:MAG: TadE/TadG family type IV pilus assembly protein [Acidobacteriota bacterium]
MNAIPARTLRTAARPGAGAESGQALVELSVALSLLVLILLGAVEFGQIAYSSIEVANAAKAGVQYGAQNGYTAADSIGIQNAAQGSAPNLSGMTVTSSVACVCSDGSASTCQNTDCPNSHIEETVTVATQYALSPIIHIPQFAGSIALHGQAIQRCGQ